MRLHLRQDFSYFKESDDASERPACCSVRMRVGDFLAHRGLQETREIALLEPRGVAATDACLYMQVRAAKEAGREYTSGNVLPPKPNVNHAYTYVPVDELAPRTSAARRTAGARPHHAALRS